MRVKLRCAVKRSGDLLQLHRTSTDEPRRKGHSKPDAIPNKSDYVITSQLDCLDIQIALVLEKALNTEIGI